MDLKAVVAPGVGLNEVVVLDSPRKNQNHTSAASPAASASHTLASNMQPSQVVTRFTVVPILIPPLFF